MVKDERDKLAEQVKVHARRMKKAETEQHSILTYTSFLGVLGLVFVLPVVGGAYLGHWLDSFAADYSIRWTVSLILLGVVVGAMNVYFLIQSRT